MRFISKAIATVTIAIALLSASLVGTAQTLFNPATQIKWSKLTGTGAPTTPCPSSTVSVGTPYDDLTLSVAYVCFSSGWAALNGPQGLFTGTYFTNAEYSNGTCSTAATISPSHGNRQKITLTAGSACALTFTQPVSSTMSIRLKVIQSSAGSFNGSITTTTGQVLWRDGQVPVITVASGAVDMIVCDLDGTQSWCQYGQNFK